VGNRLTESGIDALTGQPISRTYQYRELASRPGVTFNGVNALTQIVDNITPVQSVIYEYDRNLNQVARIKNGVRDDYFFDIRDRMVAATVNGATTEFDYDDDGMRTKKIGPSGETRYLYDGGAVLMEYNAAGQTSHKYNYGYHLLSLTAVDGALRNNQFYLVDALGSTANLANTDGNLVQSYRYDAWGRVWESVGTSTNRRQYTGHYRDDETGLDYFGARYYDSEIGRFISQDAYLGEAATPPSLHRYLYAYSNPLRYVDPSGYSSQEINSSSIAMEVDQESHETTTRRGGFSQVVATGGAGVRLTHWINGESRSSAGAEPVDEFAMTGAWAGDFARRVELWNKNKMAELEAWVQEGGSGGHVAVATIASTFTNVAASLVDPLKLGEGAAQGGWEGWLSDALRAVDLFSTLHGGIGMRGMVKDASIKTLKRAGKRWAPQSLVVDIEEQAIKEVLGNRFEMGIRASDPLTAYGSQKAARQGITPKPLTVKAKSDIYGLVEEPGFMPGLGKVKTVYRSDNDVAWVYDKVQGRFLTDKEVMEQIVKPLNRRLPPENKFMHPSHFTAFSGTDPKAPDIFRNSDPKEIWRAWGGQKPGGTLNWQDYGKLPGNPGPVGVYNGQGLQKLMTEKQVKAFAAEKGLPWHPAWDKVQSAWLPVAQGTYKIGARSALLSVPNYAMGQE
jgi:RHS repeat-associated protein